jgi:hypothetical protein
MSSEQRVFRQSGGDDVAQIAPVANQIRFQNILLNRQHVSAMAQHASLSLLLGYTQVGQHAPGCTRLCYNDYDAPDVLHCVRRHWWPGPGHLTVAH